MVAHLLWLVVSAKTDPPNPTVVAPRGWSFARPATAVYTILDVVAPGAVPVHMRDSSAEWRHPSLEVLGPEPHGTSTEPSRCPVESKHPSFQGEGGGPFWDGG